MTNRTGTRARFLTLAIAVSLAGTAIAAGQPQIVGINAAVLNNVRIRSAGAPQAHAAVVRQRVALNDEVQTGGRSQLQVLLLDKTTFTVGANARLTIDRFVYDPNRSTRSLAASVTKGAFRFISGRPDAAGSTSVRTPIASIGIRGTIFEGVVGEEAARIAAGEPGVGPRVRSDPATASLIILRGPGRGTQGRVRPGVIDVTAGGRTVTIDRPMLAVYVPAAGRAPIGPFLISPAGLQQVQALIFPGLAQAMAFEPNSRTGTGFVPTDRGGRPPRYPGYRAPGGNPDDYQGPGGYPGQGGFPGPGRFPDLPQPDGPSGGQGPMSQDPAGQGQAGQGQKSPDPAGQGQPGQGQPGAGQPSGQGQQPGQGKPKKPNAAPNAQPQTVNQAPAPSPTPTPTPTPKYPGKP